MQMNMLMRALQKNSMQSRRLFFEEIKKCRRRKQVPWEETPLMQLFTTPDEFKLLNLRATVSRVRNLLRLKGMYLLDAFRLWDYNKDEELTVQELYGGLSWLGLKLSPADIQDLVNSIDIDHDGLISFAEFKQAFRNPYQDDEEDDFTAEKAFDSTGVIVQPKLLGNEAKAAEKRHLTKEELEGITCETISVTGWMGEIWTSYGTGSHKQVGIWQADIEVSMLSSPGRRVRLPIGDYADSSFSTPNLRTRLYLELYDHVPIMSSSETIHPAIEEQFPMPIRYHLVWQQDQGQKSCYAWEGVPPSDQFVCLGMVCTTSEQPPGVPYYYHI